MLDARRDLAAARARAEGTKSTQELMRRMAFVKGKATVQVLNSDVSTAEQNAALKTYEDLLTERRKEIAEETDQTLEASAELQEKADALAAALERYGDTMAAAMPRARAVLAATAEPGETQADVQRQIGHVQDMTVALETREPELPGLPSTQKLEQATNELREQAAAVEVPQEVQNNIEKMGKDLKEYAEKLGQPFEQEPLVLQEQQKLLAARATLAGLRARVQKLTELVADLETDEQE
jgi:hypothetical protein